MRKLNDTQALALRRKTENYPEGLQIGAVEKLIERVLGQVYAQTFQIEAMESDGFDCFRLEDIVVDGHYKILLRASSGTAAGAAVRWYLQERCGSYIGPLSRRLDLPTQPPKIGECYENKSPFLYRYFLNYCTFGYSFAFWTWQEWEPFIDWLILSGYNLILNTIGNERVWTNTLQRLGYSLEEARNFLSSPAFYPWQCLMNISGWGGAAPEHFYDERVALSRQVTARLNELGANVILPGYCGMVPNDFTDHYPEAQILEQGLWCGFKRPPLLHPEDAMFRRVAEIYYEEQKQILSNCTPYFSALPFHEGGNSEHVDLPAYAKTCYGLMQSVHPTAVWVMDGWGSNPMREILQALPAENVLIINLKSEINTNGGDNFANRPWVLGTINNFGGLRVLRARLNWQYQAPHQCIDDPDHTMVGIGMLPEGLETDECCFDLFSDIAFLQEIPTISHWQTDYLRHRYGISTPALERAWDSLRRDIYLTDTSVTPLGSPLCSQPSLTVRMHTYWAGNDKHTYHPGKLIPIARDLLSEKKRLTNCIPYKTDVTEVLRQLVALTGWGVVKQLQNAFRAGDVAQFEDAAAGLMCLFQYQCLVMADSPAPTLENRLAMAQRHGKTAEEKQYFSCQLKTQLTTWGNRDAYLYLSDYSNREWSGMLEHYYRPRWEHYIDYLCHELGNPSKDVDAEYPRYDLDYAFCVSSASVGNVTPSQNLSYAEELLAYCAQLLDRQDIEVSAKAQEHSMECH